MRFHAFNGSYNRPLLDSCSKLRATFLVMCNEVDTPYSAGLRLIAKLGGTWDDLIQNTPDPGNYQFPDIYAKDIQLHSLLKKNKDINLTDEDPRRNAILAFQRAELKCKVTNMQISNRSLTSRKGDVGQVIRLAQRKIGRILGNLPNVSDLSFEFGPGAALSVSRDTTSLKKLGSTLDITPNGFSTAIDFLSSCPGWILPNGIIPYNDASFTDALNIVPGSKLAFVDKTAKTDRPICIEPLINGLIQKGYGKEIRSRLKRNAHLDLRTAQVRHREYALRASRGEDFCTVDLSSASDTISYMCVMDLLPWEWFKALDAVRSPTYTIEGKIYDFHKFSSMGNGYTFELETCIFYALSWAVCKHLGLKVDVSTYGDDIILPKGGYSLLCEVLDVCGFTVNAEKSFHTGLFYESCGGDYHSGCDVRPFYLKEALSPRIIMLMHNTLVRSGHSFWFPDTMNFLLRLLPRHFRNLYGPDDHTDGHLVDLNYCLPTYRTHVFAPRCRKPGGPQLLPWALYRQLFSSVPNEVGITEAVDDADKALSIRNSGTFRLRKKAVIYHQLSNP